MEAIFFLGRFHPLLVHLPIGFLILAILIEIYSSIFKIRINQSIINFTWFVAFFSSVLTTLLGLLIAETGHYIDENLFMHKVFGLSLTAISFISWFLRLSIFSNLFSSSLKTLSNTIIIVLLTLTGHYGGNLTHGETYLVDYAPENIKELVVKKNKYVELEVDSVKIYNDLIQPIFNQYECSACHIGQYPSAGLRLTSYEEVINSGIVDIGSHQTSLLWQSIQSGWMPPDILTDVSNEDVNIVADWIDQGARGLKTR